MNYLFLQIQSPYCQSNLLCNKRLEWCVTIVNNKYQTSLRSYFLSMFDLVVANVYMIEQIYLVVYNKKKDN